jgi:NADPH:quinone reductase-like Zn-dependent oxidoreductase
MDFLVQSRCAVYYSRVRSRVLMTSQLLIWAGSTGVGMYAIKLCTLAGYRVVTTCSPHNFDLVQSLGASAVFDYKDPNAPEKIKTWVKDQGIGPLRKGLDNISENGSLEIVASCFADGQGELAILRTTISSLDDSVLSDCV